MEYDTYTAEAVELAVDLANLDLDLADLRDPHLDERACAGELDATRVGEACDGFARDHADWLSDAPLGHADQIWLVTLGARVRSVAGAHTDAEARDQLNAMLADATPAPRVSDHSGTLHMHYAEADAPEVAGLAATVAMGMALFVCRHGRERLGVCGADDCADVFIDTSRNRSRRYCSETCASRTTVSAYRARRRAASVS